MALTPTTAIAAGQIGGQALALQAFVSALQAQVAASGTLTQISLTFTPNTTVGYGGAALTTAQTAALCNDLIVQANGLNTALIAQLALL